MSELAVWCGELGIGPPPVPERFGAALRRVSSHAFATRELTMSTYNIEDWVTEQDVPEYLVVGHAGHGVNSYAISYFLVQRNLRLFVQVGLGGVYMDVERARAAVCDGFQAAGGLIGAAERAFSPCRGLAPMLVVASEFYGSRWCVEGEPIDVAEADSGVGAVLECIRGATAWLEARR